MVAEPSQVTVACCQVAPVVGDLEANRVLLSDAIRKAADVGAQVIVLPELAASGYMFANRTELQASTQSADGETLADWTSLARALDVVIVGGFAEDGGDGHIYNSAALVDRNGVRAVYRKAHLWNLEKADLFTAASAPPPVVETDHGRIGVMICYDVEFPEWVRGVAQRGADLLCAPANWPLYPRPHGERPSEIVRLQAAAAGNRMAIACGDRTGVERGQDWLGGSVIVDADGFPVSNVRLGQPALVTGAIDLGASRDKSISERNDVHLDRRPELYE